jgi:hypothetical protein
MEREDLRIGNLVKDLDNNIFEVTSMHPKYPLEHPNYFFEVCSKDGKLINILNLKPIALTEDLILKVGFKPEIRGTFFTLRISRTTLIIWSEKYGLEVSCNNFSVISPKKSFMFHQLQNLYFALTGEELELKHESKP